MADSKTATPPQTNSPGVLSALLSFSAVTYAVVAYAYFVVFVCNAHEWPLWPRFLREEVFRFSIDHSHCEQQLLNSQLGASCLRSSAVFSRAFFESLDTWRLVRNAFNIVVFATHHSLFSRPWLKQWLRIDDAYRRSLFLIVSSGLLIHLVSFWGAHPILTGGLTEHSDTRCRVSGVILAWSNPFHWQSWLPCVLLASSILLCAHMSFDVVNFYGVGPSLGIQQSCGDITETGLFSLVRHPMMTGTLVLLWLTPVMSVDRLIFNVGWSVYIWIGTRLEERTLCDCFPSTYPSYCQRVPDGFLPLRKLTRELCRCFSKSKTD